MNVVSARAAALRILAARHATAPALTTSYSLAEFQLEAAARAREIIARRGGVIVADGVGLGKTYIAAALIEAHVAAGATVLVVVPAAVRRAWLNALRPVMDPYPSLVRVCTHGQLSRGLVRAPCPLIVVDEAHAFRNERTLRYRALRRLCQSSRVLLLTATPVNNSLADLYSQLRLFAADSAFADLGIGSLRSLLIGSDIDSEALRRLHAAVIVRRTRAQLRARFSAIALPDGSPLAFPKFVQLNNVMHEPLVSASVIAGLLDRVEFAAHCDHIARVLIGLSLLKRLQSSQAAALRSLDRLITFHDDFLAALAQGRFLSARRRPAVADDEQLFFAELLLDRLPRNLQHESVKHQVDRDLRELQIFRGHLAAKPDRKLSKLVELLTARPPPARTLVFTEFRDTAQHLWQSLAGRFRVGLITGSDSFLGRDRSSRSELIRMFAPGANGGCRGGRIEEVFVLIATDVLAEGMNLQDADAVISYDLPWNPVRLIQRAGRIDRIGSPHEQIKIYNFIPDREFDEIIGIVRRLRDKLRQLRAAIGQETPVLESTELSAFFDEENTPFRTRGFELNVGDVDQAGPIGAVASTSPNAGRVLVVWQRRGDCRELIVDQHEVRESGDLATALLQKSLESHGVYESCVIEPAIQRARNHLAQRQPAGPDLQQRALSTAIRVSIARMGLLATPNLIATAEAVLRSLPGFFGHAAAHVLRLRAAHSAADFTKALCEIRHECSEKCGVAEEEWQLVAAIACD
jgi:SNF2 family DNA or RNA helicase